MKAVIGFIAALIVLGYVGSSDYKTAKMEEAASVCQNQTDYTVPTYQQCFNNQFENNGDK